MRSPFSVYVARAAFVLISVLVGISISLGLEASSWIGTLWGLGFGLTVVGIDGLLRNFSFRGFAHGAIGLLVGLLCAKIIVGIDVLGIGWIRESLGVPFEEIRSVFNLMLYAALGFFGTSLALRSNQEEFAFIIPYVRFRQDSAQDQPLLVDTNIVIDGRIPRVAATGFLSGAIIVPRFVLDELHRLADSKESMKRDRGKRGLENLEEIRKTRSLEVVVHEDYLDKDTPVDTKLVQLARRLGARLLTNDANLGKVARLGGLAVLNILELTKALRPTVTAGEHLELALVKEGRDDHQAVGYLPDGTMIVVNNAANRIGEVVPVIVDGALQTAAGRLIFANLDKSALAALDRPH